MERELWLALYQLARACDPAPYWELVTYRDFEIVGVYLWAVVHDRPVVWACDWVNWPKSLWKGKLPSQSTMSRRLRSTEVQHLLSRMEGRLASLQRGGFVLLIDGKPLVVGTHSKDRDATWGRAGRGYARGYKLHAIYGRGAMPVQWDVAPLNVSEPEVGARLVSLLEGGGYLLGDKAFDSNPLHDACLARGWQLVAERKRPDCGLGHRRHSPRQRRSPRLDQLPQFALLRPAPRPRPARDRATPGFRERCLDSLSYSWRFVSPLLLIRVIAATAWPFMHPSQKTSAAAHPSQPQFPQRLKVQINRHALIQVIHP